MTALARCDVESVEQAALMLAGCASTTSDAIAACQRAHRATWRWHGPAQRAFDNSVGELQQRLTAIESAHDEASGVMRQYVAALLDAVVRARQADAMDREADERSAAFRRASAAAGSPLCGPDPGEALRAEAARLRRDAVSEEEIAASLASAQLEGLARRAPRALRLASTNRFVDDFAGAVEGSAVGIAQLAVLGAQSLGMGNREHAARGELWQAAKDTAKLWEPFEDMWQDGTGGRPGLALSAAVGVIGPGKLSKVVKASKVATPSKLGKHPIRDVELAYDQAWRRVELDERLAGFEPWGQTPTDMGKHGVVLLNQEKRGGHVIEEHVAQSDAYVLSRLGKVKLASTFFDEASAERLVNEVLLRRRHELWDVYLQPEGKYFELDVDFGAEVTGRFAKRGSADIFLAHGVRVIIGLEGGLPYVHTAYPTP